MSAFGVVNGKDLKLTECTGAEWLAVDANASRVLFNGLDNETHSEIRECFTANVIFLKMVSLHKQVSLTNVYLATHQLHEFEFSSEMSVVSYCSG